MAVDVARRPPPPWAGAWSVFEYHLVGYRRTWRGSVFSSFLLPLLTMLGFGVGVGAYVTGGVGGVQLPRLHGARPDRLDRDAGRDRRLSWPVLGNFEWTKIYYAQAAAPLRVGDILGRPPGVRRVPGAHQRRGVPRRSRRPSARMHSRVGGATLPIAVLLGLAVAAPTVRLQRDDPLRQLPGAAVPLRRDPDVAVRRGVLPGRVDAGRAALAGVRLAAVARRRPLPGGHARRPARVVGRRPRRLPAAWAVVGWWLAHLRFRQRLVFWGAWSPSSCPGWSRSRARSAGPRRSPSATWRRCGPPTGSC